MTTGKPTLCIIFACWMLPHLLGCETDRGQGIPLDPSVTHVSPPPRAVSGPLPTGDGLTDKLNAKKFEVAPSFIATSAVVRQRPIQGKKQSFHVPLPGPPICHTFVAAAVDTEKNVNLRITGAAKRTLAKDQTRGSTATLTNFCPTEPGNYTLTVSMEKPEAEFAIQVFSISP